MMASRGHEATPHRRRRRLTSCGSPPLPPPLYLANKYCEDIWDNSTTGLPITNSYPIGKDKQMTIAISGPPQKVKSAPRGGPVTRKKATGK